MAFRSGTPNLHRDFTKGEVTLMDGRCAPPNPSGAGLNALPPSSQRITGVNRPQLFARWPSVGGLFLAGDGGLGAIDEAHGSGGGSGQSAGGRMKHQPAARHFLPSTGAKATSSRSTGQTASAALSRIKTARLAAADQAHEIAEPLRNQGRHVGWYTRSAPGAGMLGASG